jgi:protease IV
VAKKEQASFKWGKAIFTLLLLMVLGFIAVGFLSLFFGPDFESSGGNVAVIPVEGVIMGSKDSNFLFDSITSSTETIEFIEKANKNPKISAVIIEINSPGGSAVASEEIANAMKKVNKTKVAWIREVGASGAYWIASSTDHIVANRVSITGSIGVIASYLEFNGFLNDHNITYRRLVSGKYKDIGSPFKEMTPLEQSIFERNLDEIRDYFVSEVALNRNMSKREVDRISTGVFYLGIEAKRLGLVDELGGKDEVISYIKEKENIEVDLVEYKKEKGFLDILAGTAFKQSYFVGLGIGNSIFSKKDVSTLSIMT